MASLFKIFLIILFFKFCGCAEVHYLRGVPRLGSSIYWDFYFSCNTEGQTLQWDVNGEALGGFLTEDIARVLSSSRSNFNYTATLLSLHVNGEQNRFYSILIVSQNGYSNLTVVCGNGVVSNRTTNAVNKTDLSSMSTGSIFLQNLLIEDADTSIADIFVCGVHDEYLIWQTDNITYPFFSSPDNIGQDRFIRQQNDQTVMLQAIFIAQTPYDIVSVLLVVADNTFTYVQCGNGEATLRFSIQSPPEETTTELYSENTMSSFSTQITSSETTSSASEIESNNNVVVALGVVSGIAILCAAIIVLVITTLCLLYIKKWHVSKSSNYVQEQVLRGREMNGSGVADDMNKREKKNKNWLDEEYEKLENEPESKSSYDIAKSNSDKNRFPNFYPYDQHRVILTSVSGVERSDYINATRIEGTGLPNEYFATQEPLPNTVDDFWRMVYEYNVSIIVLLTSYIERGKNKNHYWQEQKRKVPYLKGAKLKITITDTINFSNYEIRKIEIEYKSKKHHVIHYQFLGWPPREVPMFPTSFIQFIRRVNNDLRESSAPIVVQSSSGIGRSGAFITVSAMMSKIKEEKEQPCSIYEFVRDLRSRSRFMVSSVTQYKFINTVLEEIRADGDTSLEDAQLRELANNLNDDDSNNESSSKMEEQFKILNEGSRIPDIEEQSEAQKDYNTRKNRSQERVPYDGDSRVQLKRTIHSGSDYINASFVNGYRQPKQYIATQAPLLETKNDFWRMIWEHGYQAIVLLCQLHEEEIHKFWPENGSSLDYGKIEVKTDESRKLLHNCKTTRISVSRGETSQPLSVTLYQYDGWPESKKPSTTADIQYLISSLKQTSHSPDKIVVMCSDGVDRTGAFITIHAMIEKFETEKRVDIFQFIKLLRINRAHLVTTLENFKFCHAVLADYVKQRMTETGETSL